MGSWRKKMRREGRSGDSLEFTGPLWEDRPKDTGELLTALEQLVKEYNDNPEWFDDSWLKPLLTEGLKMDRVYELILDGTIKPN
jgi:hypothetical protein